jgi:photosystem II stability/assembly factor-like uncharacterized protein
MKTLRIFTFALVCLFTTSLLHAQWVRLPDVPGGFNVQKIVFPDEMHGFALGYYSFTGWNGVYETNDGGQTWDPLPMPPTIGPDIQNVHFCSADTGFVAFRKINAGGMQLAKTYDGGINWIDISPDTANLGSGISGLHFTDANHGAFGVASSIYTTTNGGQTWATHPIGLWFMVDDIDFADANHGMVVGQDGTFGYHGFLYSTADGGATWDSVFFNATNTALSNISNPEPGKGYTFRNLYGEPDVYRSLNGWATYDSIALPMLDSTMFEVPMGVDFRNGQGWMVSSLGSILRSTDDGSTWATERLADSIQIADVEIVGNKVFAAGNEGRVFMRDIVNALPTPQATHGIKAWPNPAQSGSTIHLEMPDHLATHEVVLTDVLGREISKTTPKGGLTEIQLPEGYKGILFLRTEGATFKLVVE